jgi:hypothetical protein
MIAASCFDETFELFVVSGHRERTAGMVRSERPLISRCGASIKMKVFVSLLEFEFSFSG